MILRKDLDCKDFIKNNYFIQKQAKLQSRRGKSTGSVALDMKAIRKQKDDGEER